MIDGRNLTIMGKPHDMNATQDILLEAGQDGPPLSKEEFELFMAINEFTKIAITVTFSLGFPLNWITFHIFARSKLKATSSSRYIAAIAFVDNGVIFTHFMNHLSSHFNIPVFEQHGACQMVNYFNFMCIFLSIWYTTAVVIDKFIGLYWPVKRSEYCTEFRAKCVAISLAIFSVVFYHHLVWTMGPAEVFGKTMCLPYSAPSLLETWNTLNKVDYVLVVIIPYFTIVTLLCLILFKVITYKSHARQFNGSVRGRLPSLSTEQEFKTMPLVIVVAVATIVLGLLNNICRIFEIVKPLVVTVATFLSQTSFACKFFLYVMTSEKFRDELVGLGRQIIFHVCRPCRCNRHDAEPTFITVNQQTDDVHGFHCIIEGPV